MVVACIGAMVEATQLSDRPMGILLVGEYQITILISTYFFLFVEVVKEFVFYILFTSLFLVICKTTHVRVLRL